MSKIYAPGVGENAEKVCLAGTIVKTGVKVGVFVGIKTEVKIGDIINFAGIGVGLREVIEAEKNLNSKIFVMKSETKNIPNKKTEKKFMKIRIHNLYSLCQPEACFIQKISKKYMKVYRR